MSSWMTPGRAEGPEPPPDLQDRLIAGVGAPFAFGLALLVVYAVVGDAIEIVDHFLEIGPVMLVMLVVVPAIAGFAFGTRGFVRFLGHSFYTHSDSERDWRVTLGIWVGLIGVALLIK